MAAMPALPESAFTQDQAAKWSFFVPPRDERFLSRPDTVGKVLVGAQTYGARTAATRNPVERRMIKEWSENGWRPAGHLLFDDHQVLFKSAADVVSFNRQKVSESIEGKPESPESEVREFANWRSIWRNVFEVDPATMRLDQLLGSAASRNLRLRSRSGTRQQTNKNAKLGIFPKAMHFQDLIYQQMAVHDDVLYSIEGKSFDGRSRHPASRAHARSGWNVVFRRTRENFLTAYNKDTGRMLWRLPRVNKAESPSFDRTKKATDAEETERWLTSGGMMAAPVKFADLLIVPVNRNGAIHLYGIDPAKEGETVWSAFLCDEPESGSVATAPINLTIDGSDLFASCGTGVLFVVDPTTGKIRFAKRYSRNGEPNDLLRRSYNSTFTKFDGWSSDAILPNGRELICMCSDTDSIEAIDRNDGSLIWRTGLRPYGVKVDYIIGVWGDLLYLGGKRTIIAIDLKAQGYIAWGGEPLFEDALTTGRGMVTPQGVFVPVGNSIWRFQLDGKKGRAHVLNQVEAFLGTDAPVGNLYSDGDRIWVHGASRLYALAPKED
jgi:outer membrane protein assembly factor BamB